MVWPALSRRLKSDSVIIPRCPRNWKFCQFNCFRGDFFFSGNPKKKKKNPSRNLTSVSSFQSVPRPLTRSQKSCDAGSPVSHACRGCLLFAALRPPLPSPPATLSLRPPLRGFGLKPPTVLGPLRLDLTGCGQFHVFVLPRLCSAELRSPRKFPKRCC